ncbi:DUF438 domain-containing protein [Salipaludibacillus agaradhaerens]|uniref:DUF438 domain-containing protein n=1 Tax=Salipaludibacillus agaradhaerens TaxID=76935 RepID=A0A9Q4FXZ4_SALAG|nr:DUF438 domain-containing protein [Salipaludibacillus agaradhaerens]MCR6095193.1 DUF438 domain-containing protein [Salipaludibacillus agaradhaerens]MCR6115249.1 DUF438 domain-containing protein [Salipaludibacillus agaradhaerens]
MSEMINNREKTSGEQTERQQLLKEIIKELHEGKPVEAVRQKFEQAIDSISVSEISQMEQALMEEEGISVEEVQRLCSVHTAVFKGSIEEIHQEEKLGHKPGHPVHTFIQENKEIDRLVNFTLTLHRDKFAKDPSEKTSSLILDDLNRLLGIDNHYSRKENLLFPYLEKYGIFGPTKVMWGVDDRIRDAIKAAKLKLETDSWEADEMVEAIDYIISELSEMIFKEENILLPMALEKLTEDEWLKIEREGDVIGYTLITTPAPWQPDREDLQSEGFMKDGIVQLETGIMSVQQLELMMNHLPVDITFIDEHDVVRYFSHGKERIFHRTKSVIGRSVQNCHPPQSAHIVNALLDDFKSGKKDVEDFWIPFKDKFVLIRYFAVRDKEGNYKGTVEFTQNIKPIQEISGEKRLMS